jgi:hypothetical protein
MSTPILLPVYECSKCMKPYVYRLLVNPELVSPVFALDRDCSHRSGHAVERLNSHSTPDEPVQTWAYLTGVYPR